LVITPRSPVKADPSIDPNGLLPAKHDYFRYESSLTTPPCDETIEWTILRMPLEVAEEDIATFAKLYPMNARPLQKDQSPVRAAIELGAAKPARLLPAVSQRLSQSPANTLRSQRNDATGLGGTQW
jgi:Eukaryotic-type carbonic anhydrase